MAVSRTFSIIKPDATARNLTGAVNKVIEEGGLRIVAQRRIKMTQEQAERFYSVHKERPFFGELTAFMSSGPIVAAILEKDNAVLAYRDFIGSTNPAEAAEGTIRKLYGTDIGANAVHGSDSDVLSSFAASQQYPLQKPLYQFQVCLAPAVYLPGGNN